MFQNFPEILRLPLFSLRLLFSFFSPCPPHPSPGNFLPQNPVFLGPQICSSSREKATSRGWVLGTVLDRVTPQEKRKILFFLACQKGEAFILWVQEKPTKLLPITCKIPCRESTKFTDGASAGAQGESIVRCTRLCINWEEPCMDQSQSQGKLFWSIQILPENKAPIDWSIRISLEIHMDQWFPNLSEGSGLHWYRSMESSSLNEGVRNFWARHFRMGYCQEGCLLWASEKEPVQPCKRGIDPSHSRPLRARMLKKKQSHSNT